MTSVYLCHKHLASVRGTETRANKLFKYCKEAAVIFYVHTFRPSFEGKLPLYFEIFCLCKVSCPQTLERTWNVFQHSVFLLLGCVVSILLLKNRNVPQSTVWPQCTLVPHR